MKILENTPDSNLPVSTAPARSVVQPPAGNEPAEMTLPQVAEVSQPPMVGVVSRPQFEDVDQPSAASEPRLVLARASAAARLIQRHVDMLTAQRIGLPILGLEIALGELRQIGGAQ